MICHIIVPTRATQIHEHCFGCPLLPVTEATAFATSTALRSNTFTESTVLSSPKFESHFKVTLNSQSDCIQTDSFLEPVLLHSICHSTAPHLVLAYLVSQQASGSGLCVKIRANLQSFGKTEITNSVKQSEKMKL